MTDYFFGRVMTIFIIMLVVLSPVGELVMSSVWIFALVMVGIFIFTGRLQGDDWLIQHDFIPVFLVAGGLAMIVSWYLCHENHVTMNELFHDKNAPRYVRLLPLTGISFLYMAGIISGFYRFRKNE